MEAVVQDYFNNLCCVEVVLPYNFSASGDWFGTGITDQSSFEMFYGVTVGAFSLVGTQLQVEILTSSSGTLNLSGINNIELEYLTTNTITTLNMIDSNMSVFNPTKALPNLVGLNLSGNDLVEFNPSIPLPVSLESLRLDGNNMTTAGYATSETWAAAQPTFTNICAVYLSANTDSATGTAFVTKLNTKNTTIAA